VYSDAPQNMGVCPGFCAALTCVGRGLAKGHSSSKCTIIYERDVISPRSVLNGSKPHRLIR
jgi:hypothetical protein